MTPSALSTTRAVLRNELRILFLTPLAWTFLAAFLFLGGGFFYLGILREGEASLRAMLANWGVALLFCMPLVTMRQLAEETRAGSLELLLTSPMPLGSLIAGKWLASVALSCVLLVLTMPYPVILSLYGDPDPGVLFTSYLGLAACCAAFAAAGLFASSLTREPMAAGVGGVVLLLPLWLVDGAKDVVAPDAARWLERVSVVAHLRSFAVGVLDTGDLAWFSGFTFIFLFLTWRSLESRRWR